MLQNEEIILRFIGAQVVIDFDEKREWPRFETSVKALTRTNIANVLTLTD